MLTRALKPFLFLALVIALVATGCLSSTGSSTPTGSSSGNVEEPAGRLPEPTAVDRKGAVSNIDDVEGAVFQIIGTGTINTVEDGEVLNAEWGGTGFFISPDGIAVTNNHVVAGAAVLKAYVKGESTPRNIIVLGTSECADLAVVKVEGKNYPYLTWFDGQVKTGLDVYAAGFPLVEPEYNLTKGIISKVKANGQTSWASLDFIYGHDAKINGGNSGGPLVTEDGQVVGVNYSNRGDVDQQFAIPGDLAIPVIERLQVGENVDSLGMFGQAVVFGPNQEYPGIWVQSTTTGSVIDKSGIMPGDIIYEVEGIQVATDGTMKEYCDIVRGHDLSDPLKVAVYRYGTDEILEGSLNDSPLAVTYTEVLGTGATGSSSGSSSSTGSSDAQPYFTEEWDGNTDNWVQEIGLNASDGDTNQAEIYTDNGKLVFDLGKWLIAYVFYTPYEYEDVRVDVRVENRGVNTNDVLLVCRKSDEGHYLVNIANSGLFAMYAYDGQKDLYGRMYDGGSTKIRPGKEINDYTLICQGKTLTLYVNGTLAGKYTDNKYVWRSGVIGVGMASEDRVPVTVEFENVTISEP